MKTLRIVSDGKIEGYRTALSALWVLLPSILWSAAFHTLTLCLDPILLYGLEGRVSRRWQFVIRSIWTAIFAVALLIAWNISPGSYIFYIEEALPYSPRNVIVQVVVAVLALVIFLVLKPDRATQENSNRLMLLGIAMFFLKAAVSFNLVRLDVVQQHIKSPVVLLGKKISDAFTENKGLGILSTPEFTFNHYIRHRKVASENTVLMLVESWGEKPASLKAMVAELAQSGFDIYDSGFTTYRGSTLNGEFRELCSSYMSVDQALSSSANRAECAPKYLKDKGFQIFGLHGYDKEFYARGTLWNRLSIDNMLFKNDFPDGTQCPGAFKGVCDESLIKRGVGLLEHLERPIFLYMLTLSSHEPIDPQQLEFPMQFFGNVQVDAGAQRIARRAIAELAYDVKQMTSGSCVQMYVVGDHQPPSASAKKGIFESQKVPYIAFSYNCK